MCWIICHHCKKTLYFSAHLWNKLVWRTNKSMLVTQLSKEGQMRQTAQIQQILQGKLGADCCTYASQLQGLPQTNGFGSLY